MQFSLLKNADLKDKTVFLRADLDVPLVDGKIEDDTRLKAVVPTIEHLLKQNAKVIIAGHLGRPKASNSQFAIRNLEFSLESVAEWFFKEFKIRNSKFEFKLKIKNLKLIKIGDFTGWRIGENIFLLENLRFYAGEEKNDPDFAKKLASLADIYVNDAFAVCHRKHASIIGITKFLPSFAGFHLEKEISVLSKILQDPKRPLVVVIGGKKIETKLPLVAKMHSVADYVLVGGKIAEESKEFSKIEHKKTTGKKATLLVADLTGDKTGILENSINNFIEIIGLAETIIWNGTMGLIIDNDDTNHASQRIAKAIIQSKAYSVVGGGDTTEFLRKMGIIDKFSFVSTGGGAMLAFLSGEKLPGIVALAKN